MALPANQALLESWRLSLHAKAARTVDLYLKEVHRFAAWLEDNGRPVEAPGDLLLVSRQDVEAYIGWMQQEGRAKATIRSRWIALRNLYGWLVEEDELDESPLVKVRVDKPEAPPIPVLSDSDLRALLRACEGRTFYDRRDYALIRLLAATGLRASELCALMPDDVDLTNRLVRVHHGKGDRFRVVRFDPATASALDRYKRARARHRLASVPALWIGHRGALTRKGLAPILEKRCAEAGIGHVHPHQLRHGWADRWLRNGGAEGDLQRLGGWANADIMRRYGASQAVDRALAAYDEINPLGGL